MFDNYNLKVPVSVYQEMDAYERVSPKDRYYACDTEFFINKKAYDEKRRIWNNYIKTSGRSELFPIGSIVCRSSDKWPRRANIIVDIDFQRWDNKPEITNETTDVQFWYRLMCLDNIESLDDFIKNGRIRSVHNKFDSVYSNISKHCEQFDSLVCSSIEDFSETYKHQLNEIKDMLIGKHFLGWDANDAFIYDESESRFTLKIKDVKLYIPTMGFELIPEKDITVIQRKRKYETGTLSAKYYDCFIKYKKEKLSSPVLVHINPKDNKLDFHRGYVYSDKNSIGYVSHIFGRGYKYASRQIKIDYNQLKRDEFVMSKIAYADETVRIIEKYKDFLQKCYIQWDYQMKWKKITDIVECKKQRWILFDDNSFAVQKSRVIKCETYYTSTHSSALQKFGSIHGFFKELLSKDELNDAGKMFVSHNVFTKEEIISMSKSAL